METEQRRLWICCDILDIWVWYILGLVDAGRGNVSIGYIIFTIGILRVHTYVYHILWLKLHNTITLSKTHNTKHYTEHFLLRCSASLIYFSQTQNIENSHKSASATVLLHTMLIPTTRRNEWCFRPRSCTCKAIPGRGRANEMNLVMKHAPAAGSIAWPGDKQSSTLPLCHARVPPEPTTSILH